MDHFPNPGALRREGTNLDALKAGRPSALAFQSLQGSRTNSKFPTSIVVHGEDEDLNAWHAPTNLACGFDAVDQGQSIVEDGHVGFGGDGLGDGVFAVRRFGDDRPPRLIFKDPTDT